MAENKEENKKGGIVKIAIFAAAGLSAIRYRFRNRSSYFWWRKRT